MVTEERNLTKSQMIRRLAMHGISDRDIQQAVIKKFGACGLPYVRTYARQRFPGLTREMRKTSRG